jgi:hypothetical protein
MHSVPFIKVNSRAGLCGNGANGVKGGAAFLGMERRRAPGWRSILPQPQR